MIIKKNQDIEEEKIKLFPKIYEQIMNQWMITFSQYIVCVTLPLHVCFHKIIQEIEEIRYSNIIPKMYREIVNKCMNIKVKRRLKISEISMIPLMYEQIII